MPPAVAGTWASAYWASLTVGRVAIATVVRRTSVVRLLRGSMTLAPLAALLIWVGDGSRAALVGVAGLGLSLAPIYPLLVSATPERVGSRYATHAIGAQVAAAYLGAAAVPGLVGVAAREYGLEILGPLLTMAALGVFLVHEAVVRAVMRPVSAGPGLRAPAEPTSRAPLSNR